MKPGHVFLGLSLIANVALAAAFWWPRAATPSVKPQAMSVALPPKAEPLTREAEIAAALAADPEFVDAIKSGDPKRMREALTRAGFPPSYVRDMVTFHTGNTVTPEHIALLREQANRPFWKISPGPGEVALQKMLRERDAKSADATKEAFGGKIPPHPLEALNQQRRYRFLPEDKIAAVIRLDADYAELASANRGVAPAEAAERARLLQQEKRNDLAKVLTPQELELYDLNVSPTAENMRRQLTLFQPTEAEFRSIFELQRGFDDKYGGAFGGPPDQAKVQERLADQKALDDQVRALLGDTRFAEYKRTQDYGYRAAVEIASHFNLPPTTAVEAYTLQQSFVTRANEITKAAATDKVAAAAQATALLNEAGAEFTKLLGAAGADAYKKTGGRLWMTSLERIK